MNLLELTLVMLAIILVEAILKSTRVLPRLARVMRMTMYHFIHNQFMYTRTMLQAYALLVVVY